MRAVTIDDGRLVLGERPDPEPGRGELLVRSGRPGSTAPTCSRPTSPGWS